MTLRKVASVAFMAAAVAPASAEYYPGRPMPDRPGCVQTRCEDICIAGRWARRCHWRCPPRQVTPPRQYFAAPPTPSYRYAPTPAPTPRLFYTAPNVPPLPDLMCAFLVLLIVVGTVAGISLLVQSVSTALTRRATVRAERDTISARALTAQAENTTRTIDSFINRAARSYFERGRAAIDREWTRD